eukprot:s3530_g4.t2
MDSSEGWKFLEAKTAPWEHRPPPPPVREEPPPVEEDQEWQRIWDLYEGQKGASFEEDRDADVFEVDLPIEVPQLSQIPPLESQREALRSLEMEIPTFAQVRDPNRPGRSEICMLGANCYNPREQKVHVFPVLDPSQEKVVFLTNCNVFRRDAVAAMIFACLTHVVDEHISSGTTAESR